jgi:hypothetical protein
MIEFKGAVKAASIHEFMSSSVRFEGSIDDKHISLSIDGSPAIIDKIIQIYGFNAREAIIKIGDGEDL